MTAPLRQNHHGVGRLHQTALRSFDESEREPAGTPHLRVGIFFSQQSAHIKQKRRSRKKSENPGHDAGYVRPGVYETNVTLTRQPKSVDYPHSRIERGRGKSRSLVVPEPAPLDTKGGKVCSDLSFPLP